MANLTVWTIGHSTHSYENFLMLLRGANITAIADVRTVPHSRHFSQFNKDILKSELKSDGIVYSFLGNELGGRPKKSGYYCEGVADYEKMAEANEFKNGLDRVLEGAQKYRIALMCSEHDPLDCHRCLLVGRALSEKRIDVKHILSSGAVITHLEIEQRLLAIAGSQNDDLFMPAAERLSVAYRKRARKVAFADSSLVEKTA